MFTLGGLAVLTVVVILAFQSLSQLDGNIARLVRPPSLERMQQLTETVTRADGRKIVVLTTREADESIDAFWLRHDAAVKKVQNA